MTRTFTEIKQNILEELKNYKNNNYDMFDFQTDEGIDEFLHEYTNTDRSYVEYFNKEIIDWEIGENTLLECINYIIESYKDMCGDEAYPFSSLIDKKEIQEEFVYFVGYEFKQQLLEEESEEED